MTINKRKRILIIAGESSGDQHAARYVREHQKMNPDIIFDAFGQKELKSVATNFIYDTEKISVVGIMEVISKYKEITDALKLAKSHIDKTRPNLIVLVDYVEFNLKIAKFAKSLGIRVIFYIAPQLWAWRERRAHNLAKNIDHLAVIFPFEEIFFQQYTDNVSYVGHPLFENRDLLSSVKKYEDRDTDLGIFPGSRESEIKNNIYTMLDCIQKNKNEKIKIFYANKTSLDLLEKLLPPEFHSKLESGKDIARVSSCKKALCASGTVTLELAILEIPMVVMYKLSFVTFFIMRALVKLKYIGLVNLVLGDNIGQEPIVQEYIQPSYSDQIDIMVELNKIDNDQLYRNNMLDKFREIKDKLSIESEKKLWMIAEDLI
ncbi:MAG: lipid-A-disaccharide synthase [Pseudomonadota bacterium]|nr:lipid-A-disaccharide synthase [Pseudomonadota bacterium]